MTPKMSHSTGSVPCSRSEPPLPRSINWPEYPEMSPEDEEGFVMETIDHQWEPDWPEWLKETARCIDKLCNMEEKNG